MQPVIPPPLANAPPPVVKLQVGNGPSNFNLPPLINPQAQGPRLTDGSNQILRIPATPLGVQQPVPTKVTTVIEKEQIVRVGNSPNNPAQIQPLQNTVQLNMAPPVATLGNITPDAPTQPMLQPAGQPDPYSQFQPMDNNSYMQMNGMQSGMEFQQYDPSNPIQPIGDQMNQQYYQPVQGMEMNDSMQQYQPAFSQEYSDPNQPAFSQEYSGPNQPQQSFQDSYYSQPEQDKTDYCAQASPAEQGQTSFQDAYYTQPNQTEQGQTSFQDEYYAQINQTEQGQASFQDEYYTQNSQTEQVQNQDYYPGAEPNSQNQQYQNYYYDPNQQHQAYSPNPQTNSNRQQITLPNLPAEEENDTVNYQQLTHQSILHNQQQKTGLNQTINPVKLDVPTNQQTLEVDNRPKPTVTEEPKQSKVEIKYQANQPSAVGAGSNICPKCNFGTVEPVHYFCSQCECKSCLSFRADNSCYCAYHTCSVQNCSNPRSPGSMYCKDHKCNASNCPNLREDNKLYCISHACTNCTKPKNIRSSYFCDDCKCMNPDCNKQKEKGDYCTHHSCKYPGCSNMSDIYSAFCKSHKCQICDHPIKEPGYFYCDDHNCKYSRCKEQSLRNSDCCQRHKKKFSFMNKQ